MPGEDVNLKIILVVDSSIDLSSNLNLSNGNVIWNPDTEAPDLIQTGRDKLNEDGYTRCRC